MKSSKPHTLGYGKVHDSYKPICLIITSVKSFSIPDPQALFLVVYSELDGTEHNKVNWVKAKANYHRKREAAR
jgi:hypothetical protein